MIVVDTTVWIDFLEARGTAFDRHLTDLLERDAPIALVDIVYCEMTSASLTGRRAGRSAGLLAGSGWPCNG